MSRSLKRPEGDAELRKSWRSDRPSGVSAKLWLIVRRATATLIAIALVGLMAWLFIGPMMRPRTYLVVLMTDQVATLAASPVEFAYEDSAGFMNLADALTPLKTGGTAVSICRMVKPQDVSKFLAEVASSPIQARDSLVVFAAAHGVVTKGEGGNELSPGLACSNYRPQGNSPSDEGLIALTKLLDEIEKIPCGTKLLALDTGRGDLITAAEAPAASFAAQARSVIDARKDSSVAVLLSHSPGETSRVSGTLQRSVFGYVLARGLLGEANPDGDGDISLVELAGYVTANVQQWVELATEGAETQTPELIAANDVRTARVINVLHGDPPPVGEQQTSTAGQIGEFLLNITGDMGIGDMIGWGGDDGDATADAPQPVAAAGQASTINQQSENLRTELQSAWDGTSKVANGPLHPAQFAPHVWRLHLDELLWNDRMQRSGTYPRAQRIDFKVLGTPLDRVLKTNRALQGLLQPESAADSSVAPVVAIDELAERQRRSLSLDTKNLSIALRQRAHPLDPERDKDLAQFVEQYDAWLASTNDNDRELESLAKLLAGTSWHEFAELQLFERLTNDPQIARSDARVSLLARRKAEKVVANPLWGQGWGQPEVAEADSLRLEAERLLLDRTVRDWVMLVRANLKRANDGYDRVASLLQTIEQAQRTYAIEAFHLRDYVRWAHVARDRNYAQDTRKHIESLAQLTRLLDSPASSTQANVVALVDQVTVSGRLLRTPFESQSAELGKIAAQLGSPLLKPSDHTSLIDAWKKADEPILARFEPTVPAVDAASPSNRPPLPKVDVELLNLDIAMHNLLAGEPIALVSDATNQDAISAVVGQLARFQRGLPATIRSIAGNDADTSGDASRLGRFQQLVAAERLLYLMQPTRLADTSCDLHELDNRKLSIHEQLEREAWYATFLAAMRRANDAQQDESQPEPYSTRAEAYATLGNSLQLEPRLSARLDDELAIVIAPSQVQLVNDRSAIFDVTITKRTAQSIPVWIAVQSDDSLVKITGLDPNAPIHTDEALRQAMPSSAYPIRPSVPNLEPTFELSATSRTFQLKVSRDDLVAGGQTNVVVRAISPKSYLRRVVPVTIPGRSGLGLSVTNDGGKTTELLKARDSLQFFAFRQQGLKFDVTNTGNSERNLIARLYKPQSLPTEAELYIASGAVSKETSLQILDRFRTGKPVLEANINNLADGASVPIVFDWKSIADPFEITLAEPAILLEVFDTQKQESTLRLLRFEAWRPNIFLKATATYDPAGPEVEIEIAPVTGTELPLDGNAIDVAIQVDDEYLDVGANWARNIKLTGPDYMGRITVPLNERFPTPSADGDAYIRLLLSVDGYPRAFEFRVTTPDQFENLTPFADKAIRITSLNPSASDFSSKTTSEVTVGIEVDVPSGYFLQPDNLVRVGVDQNVNNQLDGKEFASLRADRAVKWVLTPPLSSATLAIEPKVSDFVIPCPIAGLNVETDIRAEIANLELVEAEDSMPVRIDFDGPVFDDPRPLVANNKLRIAFETYDVMLDATTEITGYIDSAIDKLEKGKQVNNTAWEIAFDLTDVGVGDNHVATIIARDRVGNTNQVRVRFNVTSADKVKAAPPVNGGGTPVITPPRAVKNRVSGVVRCRNFAASDLMNVKVSLVPAEGQPTSAKIGPENQFDFGSVAPGKYTIEAEGMAFNYPYKATKEIEVLGQQGKPVAVTMELK